MGASNVFPLSDGITQVTALGLVLVLLFVPGRLASNLHMQRRLYLDDYVAVVGVTLFLTFAGICFGIDAYARYYQGPGAWDPTVPFFLKTIFATEALISPASLSAKASILLLYLRIFNPSLRLRQCVVVTAGIAVLFALPNIPVFAFYCAPNATTTTWDPVIAQTCAAANTWAALQQVVDAHINLAIFLLPLPTIFRLHLTLKRRLLLAFVLMHGIFALAASIVGAIYRVGLAKTPASDADSALWLRSAAFTACGVELSMTLVTGSMHACWGYLRAAHAYYQSSRGSSGGNSYYDSERQGFASQSYEKNSSDARKTSNATTHPEGSLRTASLSHDGTRSSKMPTSSTGASSRRWAVAFSTYPRSQSIPTVDEELDLNASEPPANTAAVSSPQEITAAMSKYPRTPSESEHSVPSQPPSPAVTVFAAPTAQAEQPTTHTAASQTERMETAAAQPSDKTQSHRRNSLMAEIEAAVAASGTARLVVHRERPSSGASYDAVHVLQPLEASRSTDTTPSYPVLPDSTVSLDPRCEYVVQRQGEDYVVLKKLKPSAMGIRRDVLMEVSESVKEV